MQAMQFWRSRVNTNLKPQSQLPGIGLADSVGYGRRHPGTGKEVPTQ
jgi:hypothetical protein